MNCNEYNELKIKRFYSTIYTYIHIRFHRKLSKQGLTEIITQNEYVYSYHTLPHLAKKHMDHICQQLYELERNNVLAEIEQVESW